MEEVIVDTMCFIKILLTKGDRVIRESIDNPEKEKALSYAEGTCDTCHKVLEFIIERYDMYCSSANLYDNTEKLKCQEEEINNELQQEGGYEWEVEFYK